MHFRYDKKVNINENDNQLIRVCFFKMNTRKSTTLSNNLKAQAFLNGSNDR